MVKVTLLPFNFYIHKRPSSRKAFTAPGTLFSSVSRLQWNSGHQAWQSGRYRLSFRKTLNNLFRTLTDQHGEVLYKKSLRLFSDTVRVKGKRRSRRFQRQFLSYTLSHLPFPSRRRLAARRQQQRSRAHRLAGTNTVNGGLSRAHLRVTQSGAGLSSSGWRRRQEHRQRSRNERYSRSGSTRRHAYSREAELSTRSCRPAAVTRLVVTSNLIFTPLLQRRARSLRARSGELLYVEYKPQRAFNGCRLRKAPGKKVRLRRGRFSTPRVRSSSSQFSRSTVGSADWSRRMVRLS